MITKEKQIRRSHGGRHNYAIDFLSSIHIPIFSYGKCESKSYGTNRYCTNYGELGDGKCVDCWDRTESNKNAIFKDKQMRKLERQNAR